MILVAMVILSSPSVMGRVGAEAWEGEVDPGGRKVQSFGVAMLRVAVPVAGGSLALTFDTDTLDLSMDGVEISDRLHLGARLRGERPFAGLLPDYVREGTRYLALGFDASYLEGGASVKALASPHSVQVEAAARLWSFAERKDTSPDFVLPANTSMLSLLLRYTYWDLAPELSLSQPYRTRIRAVGLGLGVEVLGTTLTDPSELGQPGPLGELDARNEGHAQSAILRQWLRAGARLTDGLRLQADEWSGYGFDETDLTRARIGGSAHYFVALPGAAWATFLASRYAVARTSLSLAAFGDSEVGASITGAIVDDFDRTGVSAAGVGVSGELFLDARLGDFQIDLSVGHFEPIDRPSFARSSPVSAWISIGYGLEL